MNRLKPAIGAVAAVAAITLLTSCSQPGPRTVLPVESPSSAATSATPGTPTGGTVGPSGDPSTPADSTAPNDLKKSPLVRSLRSGGLTINVTYTAPVPVARWSPEGSKPIGVQLTILDRQHPGKKIYLTRATARFTVRDDDSDLPGPDPVIDTANIQPGYLATFPYSYVQSFAVPALDPSAESVSVDFKFELVTLVDRKAKDYSKQTVTNTVQVALAF